ncbi:MAG: tetratricopeptide repeat protein [Candidatus Baltobacteraceae bacterium]
MSDQAGARPATPRPGNLPTGTVTFLFSDIEASTKRWEAHREAMALALRRHDAILREAIERHEGYVFKTVGDAFCAAFQRATQAIAAALDAQHALAAEDFSAVGGLLVRMALHTGDADERDSDYFGPALNRVARLLATCHGGQVLVSGTAAAVIADSMPTRTGLRDLGEHRLEDFAEPARVHQLVADGLRDVFPALRSSDALPNNLPLALTSFIGRDQVVAEITRLVAAFPLVTLVGAGGAGKTRTAVQAGRELLPDFNAGTWLVEFAALTDPARVPGAIVQTLGLAESPDHPALDVALAHLRGKHLLLILDNSEHVIDAVREAVAAIVRVCPGVRTLATSREALNIAGEHVFRIPSLATPEADPGLTATASMAFGAVALFVDRAVSASPRFVLDDENVPFVAEITRRLDGIPLALELAAARVKVLAPRELAHKLDERFRLLTGGDRSALPRQQTMRALIDWSYELLSNDERALFRHLAIFAGAFTLESAVGIDPNAEADEFGVLDLLSSLVDKSLLQAEFTPDATRYRLLESTREYAREKLRERGEYEATARAHAVRYLELAEGFDARWATMSGLAWSAQVDPEFDNFRSALDWALGARRDVELGQRLAVGLRRIYLYRAPSEGWHWAELALSFVDDSTSLRTVAGLELVRANLGMALKRHQASFAAGTRALATYRKLGDTLGAAQAASLAGSALVFLGRVDEGERLLHEALATASTLGARKFAGLVLQDLAFARQIAGDVGGARGFFAEALAAFKETGAERQIARVAGNLGDAEFRGGDAEAALRLVGEALRADRALGSLRSAATDLSNLAAYLVTLGRWDEAREYAREALALARDAQDDVVFAYALQHLVAVATLRESKPGTRTSEYLSRAARLFGYVDATLAAFGTAREYTEQQEYDAIAIALHAAFDETQRRGLEAEGRSWTKERAASEALAIAAMEV